VSRLLVVERDGPSREALRHALSLAGHALEEADGEEAALEALRRAPCDAAVVSLRQPEGEALSLLPRLRALDPDLRPVVLVGAQGARAAATVLRAGASHCLAGPWEREELLAVVARALEERRLRRELEVVRRRDGQERPDAVVDLPSAAWRRAHRELLEVADNARAAALLTGEPGTGKEVAAALLHRASARARGPFVTLHATALPPGGLEGELFGHESGGAGHVRGLRRGLLELAHGGTLFLDEVGELPPALQGALLRVMEGQPYRRPGGEREVRPDVRVVVATRRDLGRLVREGRLREDLFWRLKVNEVVLPPLRERPEDVHPLAAHLLSRLSRELGRGPLHLAPDALAGLEGYDWPGNVRELRNVLERGALLAREGLLGCEHLPLELRPRMAPPDPAAAPSEGPSPPAPLDAVVRRHVLEAYAACGSNLSLTARSLGISRVALRRRLREYGAKEPAPGTDGGTEGGTDGAEGADAEGELSPPRARAAGT
jgi:DNA-binding NtrC family response regulator